MPLAKTIIVRHWLYIVIPLVIITMVVSIYMTQFAFKVQTSGRPLSISIKTEMVLPNANTERLPAKIKVSEPSRVPSNSLPIIMNEAILPDYEEREVGSFSNGKVRMTMVVDGLEVKYLMVYNETTRTVYAVVRENDKIYETPIAGNTVASVDYQFSLIKSPPDDPDDPNSIHYPEGISIGLGG